MIEIEVWWYETESFLSEKVNVDVKNGVWYRIFDRNGPIRKNMKIDFIFFCEMVKKWSKLKFDGTELNHFCSIKPILMSKVASDTRFLMKTAENEKIWKF